MLFGVKVWISGLADGIRNMLFSPLPWWMLRGLTVIDPVIIMHRSVSILAGTTLSIAVRPVFMRYHVSEIRFLPQPRTSDISLLTPSWGLPLVAAVIDLVIILSRLVWTLGSTALATGVIPGFS